MNGCTTPLHTEIPLQAAVTHSDQNQNKRWRFLRPLPVICFDPCVVVHRWKSQKFCANFPNETEPRTRKNCVEAWTSAYLFEPQQQQAENVPRQVTNPGGNLRRLWQLRWVKLKLLGIHSWRRRRRLRTVMRVDFHSHTHGCDGWIQCCCSNY